MKNYVTFGQEHSHIINYKTIDKNCVATYESDDYDSGRAMAFKIFGEKFCFHYVEKDFDFSSMRFYPRGFIEV